MMINKIPCTRCGDMILPTTAQRTGGLCMPCKQGNRENLEASKRYYEEQKKYDPHRELWNSLVHRVNKSETGYSGLSYDEQLYFAGSLVGEVFNGGFEQYFWNPSGDMLPDAIVCLQVIGAHHSLDLLQRALQLLFGDTDPMLDCPERRAFLLLKVDVLRSQMLEELDREFWKNEDNIDERLSAFATAKNLIDPFLK